MSAPAYGLWIAGEWRYTGEWDQVHHRYTGQLLARVSRARREDVDDAVKAAAGAQRRSDLTPYDRFEILRKAAELTRERAPEIALTMVRESGMTLKDARGELDRAVQTFLLSAEEAKRIVGECVPVQGVPGMEHRMAFTIRVPVGVVCAITPFNAPFNNVVHKVAPAIAAGNAVVLKPAPATPLSALAVLQILLDAGLPSDLIQVVLGGSEVGEWLLEHPGINFYTFTGSARVGRLIKERTGLRRVALELGNNSATIVCADADLDLAARLLVRGGFRKAGQVCVSVQRIYVHRSVEEALLERLVRETNRLKIGDPEDPDTDVGPMISEERARQVESWVAEAVAAGAQVVVGGRREGALFYPTILAQGTDDMRVVCEEIFAPVMTVIPFDNLDDAIERVNASPYGLQAGIFTQDLDVAFYAARHLEVGGVNINETSNTRAEPMPYGGVKESGIGREGPRYAIEQMTDLRLVFLNLRSPVA